MLLSQRKRETVVEKIIPLLQEKKRLEESRNIIETRLREIVLELMTPSEKYLAENHKDIVIPFENLEYSRDFTLCKGIEITSTFSKYWYYWKYYEVFEINKKDLDIFYPAIFGSGSSLEELKKEIERRNPARYEEIEELLIKHFSIKSALEKKLELLTKVLENPQLGLTNLKKCFPELYKIVKSC